jgi:hypothetical protein
MKNLYLTDIHYLAVFVAWIVHIVIGTNMVST